MDCAVRAVSDDFIRALGVVLTKIVSDVVPEYGSLSCFNSINAPPISDYLVRIARYVNCSNECFVLALVYIDRIMKMHKFSVSVLNIHRLLITSVMLAAKFSDDVYYSNSFYAQVGGIKVAEMNILEAQFLMLIKYQLFVSAKDYENCRKGVESSSNKIYTIPLLSQNNTHKNTNNTFNNNKPKYSNDNRTYNSSDRLYNSSDRLFNSNDNRVYNSNDRVFNSTNSYDSENRVFNSGNSGYNGNPIPNTSTYTGKVYNNSLFNGLKGYGSGYTNVKSLYDDLYSKLQLNKDNGRYNTADNKGKAYNPHSYYNTVGQNYNTLNYTLKQNNINQNTTNHNTLNQNTIHNTMNNTIRHNTLNKPVYNTINHNTVNHNTIAHNTVNHNTIAHNTNTHNTLRSTLGHVKSESLNVHGAGFNEYSGYDHGSTFKNDDEYLITSEKLSLSSYIYYYGEDGFARTESTLTVSTSASDTQEVPDEAALRDRESFRTKFDECEAFVNALESRFNDTLQRKCSTHLGPVHQLALINLKNDW